MLLFIDCEGEPIQEFSALYVDSATYSIVDVFHHHIRFPRQHGFDTDWWARRHIHGLNRDYLARYGLRDERALLSTFQSWLTTHPYSIIFANAPYKESTFLQLSVSDVCLPPWKERADLRCHTVALSAKKCATPILGVTCDAHSSFRAFLPRRPYAPSSTELLKCEYAFHCSLYDSLECYLFYKDKNRQ